MKEVLASGGARRQRRRANFVVCCDVYLLFVHSPSHVSFAHDTIHVVSVCLSTSFLILSPCLGLQFLVPN
jgi:hypothetical protein